MHVVPSRFADGFSVASACRERLINRKAARCADITFTSLGRLCPAYFKAVPSTIFGPIERGIGQDQQGSKGSLGRQITRPDADRVGDVLH